MIKLIYKNKDERTSAFFGLFSFDIFELSKIKGIGHVRFFGKGVQWKDTKEHRLRFSERNGHVKYLKIRRYIFKYLP